VAGKSVIDVKILGDNKSLSSALSDSESKIGKFGKAAAGIGLALGASAVVAGAALFKIGSDFDKQFDKIRVGTGATGDALAGLEDSFKNVLKDVPASFDDAGTAIADLNTRLGLTGQPLEDLAAQMLNLSRLTETDLASNVDNITRVFGDWGISTGDQAASMDQLYRAAQNSGIGIDSLSSSVVQFGAPLRNLGFGFDESLALLAQFNKTGVNTETVFAGLKAGVGKLAKAGEDVPATFRRVVDEITALGPGTEATALAIELFGQRAGPDLADAIAGGKFEIDAMLGAITDGADTINGAAKDTESFSEKWTLLKNRVLVGLQPLATKVFDAIGRAMDKLGPKVEVVVAWFTENLPKAIQAIRDGWDRWGQPVFDAVVEAVGDVVKFMQDNWPKVQDAIESVFGWMRDNKDVVIGAFIGIGVAVATILVPAFVAWAVAAAAAAAATIVAAAPFIALGAALAAIGAAAVWAYQNVDWFRSAVDAVASFFRDTVWPIMQETAAVIVDVFGGIVQFISDNWGTIQTIIETVFDAVSLYVETVWAIIKAAIIDPVTAIVEFIVEHWDMIAAVTTEVFDAIATYVGTVWDTIKGVIEAAIGFIQGVIDVVMGLIKGDWGRAWDGIKEIVSSTWDAIKTVVSGAIGVVLGFIKGIPSKVFGVAWTMFNSISDNMGKVRDWVMEKGQEFLDWVLGMPGKLVGKFAGMWDGISSAFKSAINSIIRGWNALEFKVPGFKVGPIGYDGFTLGLPDIPLLHSGGVVPGPVGTEQLTMLQAGERVTPIGGGNDEPDWTAIAREMAREYARTLQQEARAA